MKDTLTTGEMARLSNTTLRTVRFYEEARILTPIGRTGGGHRVFLRDQLERLLLVTDMREAGLSLDEIRQLLETKTNAGSGGEAATSAIQILKGHIGALKAKAEVIRRLTTDLEETVKAAEACLGCHDPSFPGGCASCGRTAAPEARPRAMRVLWSLTK